MSTIKFVVPELTGKYIHRLVISDDSFNALILNNEDLFINKSILNGSDTQFVNIYYENNRLNITIYESYTDEQYNVLPDDEKKSYKGFLLEIEGDLEDKFEKVEGEEYVYFKSKVKRVPVKRLTYEDFFEFMGCGDYCRSEKLIGFIQEKNLEEELHTYLKSKLSYKELLNYTTKEVEIS